MEPPSAGANIVVASNAPNPNTSPMLITVPSALPRGTFFAGCGPIHASARHTFRGVARVSDEPVEAASGALGVSQVLTLGDGPTLMTRRAGRRGRWRSSSSPDDGATFVHADAIVRCRRRCRARGGFRRAQRARSSANGLTHPAAGTRAGVGQNADEFHAEPSLARNPNRLGGACGSGAAPRVRSSRGDRGRVEQRADRRGAHLQRAAADGGRVEGLLRARPGRQAGEHGHGRGLGEAGLTKVLNGGSWVAQRRIPREARGSLQA